MNQRRKRHLSISRDTLLFVVGLALTINEGLFRKADRPSLLILYGAMMSLPAYIQVVEKKKAKKEDALNTGEIEKVL